MFIKLTERPEASGPKPTTGRESTIIKQIKLAERSRSQHF